MLVTLSDLARFRGFFCTLQSKDTLYLIDKVTNDTTETNTLRKSTNFQANPSTGEFYAKGYRRIDITGQTLDINTLNLSSGSPMTISFSIHSTSGLVMTFLNHTLLSLPSKALLILLSSML